MNLQAKLFSIVLVNLNGGDFLEQAILSILNQGFSDYELIVIDGGSDDNSVSIINKYVSSIAYWVSESDSGQSEAFNKGFAQAGGQFLFWLNADDILLPNALQTIACAIAKQPSVKWFVGNTIFFDKAGIVIRCRRLPNWHKILITNGVIYIGGPSSIFHRSIYEQVGEFDPSLHYAMDTDLWMRFVAHAQSFKRIDAYLWGFRIHAGSKTSHSFEEKSEPMRAEELRIQLKNSHPFLPSKALLLFAYKCIDGSFLSSVLDSIKLKGRKLIP